MALALGAWPTLATAGHPGDGTPGEKKPAFDPHDVPAKVERALGGEVQRTPDGAYAVDARRGPDLYTHGPDPKTPVLSGGKAPPGDPFGARFGSEPTRDVVCVPPVDANSDFYQHVIYMRHPGTTSQYSTVKADIQEEIEQMNHLLNASSVASGGPTADYKVLCDAGGEIQVDEFVSNAARTFNGVSSAARAAGYNKQNVDYTIFYDGEAVTPQCGVGAIYPTSSGGEVLSVNNPNNLGNVHGITWESCWDGITAMHENGHNQGAVQYNAPHSTGNGLHCFDHEDVMCYNDGGDLDPGPPLATDHCSAGTLRFDCGFNTYFDSATEGGEYLASNWNMGSALNRFIEFDAGGGGPANPPPTAAFTYDCDQSLSCDFTDQSSDDSAVDEWSWDFDDGNGSTTQAPTHQYAAPGTYDVSLEVTDDEDATDSITIPVHVDDGQPTPLVNKQFLETASGPQGTFDHYSFEVPRKRKLVIDLFGEPCFFAGDDSDLCIPDLDLYVGFEFEPNLDDYDCRPFLFGINERCKAGRARKGTYFIAVHNFAAASGTDYTIRAVHKKRN